jgi:cytochrome c oxidase cbb3-type subunit 2
MRTDRAPAVRAAAAVAAVYTAFLLCAQFGFLAQLATRLGDRPRLLHGVLAAMAAAGIAAGFAAARWRGVSLRAALVATAAACALSTAAGGVATSLAAAAGLGGALGFATVALAGRLPRLAPRGEWGRVAGWGTGIAYAISNLPPLFAGAPAVRALLPALLCLVAAAVAPREREAPASPAAAPGSALGFASVVLGFLALVLVDSAAFAHVQATPALRAATWGTPALQLRQGAVHLGAAVVAGWLLDRGRLRVLLLATAALFAVALPALADAAARPVAGALYAAGISLYSAALVAAPALTGAAASAPWRAAALFAVAGWVGSGLGVGAAEQGRLGAAAALGAAAFAFHLALGARGASRRALRAALPVAAAAAGGLLLFNTAPAAPRAASAVARGRQVYLAEGCQHCHSQYVRPVAHDDPWWGPRRALDRTERPPTPGNRRLGPDLANAGLRRSAFWHAAHLRAPQRLSPGSRMPSFAHLFDDGSGRGDDLVAYLASLGVGHEAERAAAVAAWRPPAGVAGDPRRGRALFARHCAPCHGEEGRGDGEVTRAVRRPTLDLTKGAFFRVAPAPGESLDDALARAIRFGLPPGTMPGHEWLSDRELADLVAFVRSLAAGSTTAG